MKRIKDKKGTKLSYKICNFMEQRKTDSNNKLVRLVWSILLFIVKGILFLYKSAVLCIIVTVVGYIVLSNTKVYTDMTQSAYEAIANMNEGSFRQYTNTVFLDCNDNLMGEINSGNYIYTDISEIPMDLQYAYIAEEDKNFQTHPGIDIKATVRAAVALVINKGEITQGGSTITQQVIKNNLLSQERTFTRKFLELLIAPQLEKNYSKAEIMEFYCNSNYYGNGCYGVASAAKFYFGKEPKELTLAECAMIAGISNSPNNYNPVASMDLAVTKMTTVLGQMLMEGYITQEDYDTAVNEEIVVTQTETTLVSTANYMCTYAMYSAVLELMEINGFHFQYVFDNQEEYAQYKEKYEEAYKTYASEIRSGGYTIKTTLNPEIQAQLQESIDSSLSGYQDIQDNGKYMMQGAAVCIDNTSNCVVAIVGGRGTNDEYNRGFLSTRQPGSCIKPLLVYTPAFDLGIIHASSLFTDQKIYAVEDDTESYSPKNANGRYLGEMTIREAVARSVNTIAYQVFDKVGKSMGLKYLESMKFTSLHSADYASESLALGGFTNGVKVVDMAKGYSALANYGQYSDKTCLRTIVHETKGQIYNNENEKTYQVYSQDAAFIMTDVLQGVFNETYGTAYKKGISQIAAGKTGTTNSNRDAWFCGYTKYYTTVVWVGRDDNGQVEGLVGSSYPCEIWKKFMKTLHKDQPLDDYEIVDTIEYHKVVGGVMTDEIIEKELISPQGTTYEKRPAGYEYYSLQAKEAKEKYENEKTMEETTKNAETAVSSFEEYNIDSVEKALELDKKYSEVLALIDQIPDEYVRAKYLVRVTGKYESYSYEMMETWNTLILEKETEEQLMQQNENAIAAEQQKEFAYTKLYQQRITYMDWYINELNNREYNTQVTQNLLNDAIKYLGNLEGYEEYDSYVQQIETIKKKLESLPTEIPIPKIPENSLDEQPDASDYVQPTPTPVVITPTPTPTLQATPTPQVIVIRPGNTNTQ